MGRYFVGGLLCQSWLSPTNCPPSIWSCLLNFGVVLWGFTVFELCSANDGRAPFKFLQTNCSPSILSSAQPMMVQLSFKFPQTDCSPSILSSAQPMMVQLSFKFPQTGCSPSIRSSCFLGGNIVFDLCSANDGTAPFKLIKTNCSSSI